MNTAAPDPSAPSDAAIAQAFREMQRDVEMSRPHRSGNTSDAHVERILRRAREIDASAPAAAVGGERVTPEMWMELGRGQALAEFTGQRRKERNERFGLTQDETYEGFLVETLKNFWRNTFISVRTTQYQMEGKLFEEAINTAEYDANEAEREFIDAMAKRDMIAPVTSPAAPVGGFVVDEMVNRFLGWPLPRDFAPDCGISFDGRKDDEWNKNKSWPIGTNLLTAEQAKAMFQYCAAPPAAQSSAKDGARVSQHGGPPMTLRECMEAEEATTGAGLVDGERLKDVLRTVRKAISGDGGVEHWIVDTETEQTLGQLIEAALGREVSK